MAETFDLEVGDRITFRAATRWSDRALTRVVTGFSYTGQPMVRAHGWAGFLVRRNEITAVEKRAA